MNDAIIWLGGTVGMFSVIFFVFGCCIGSFLNVVIYRLPLGKNLISPPSHCPKCDYRIPVYQNIPLFTWLWQRGKCADCKRSIPVRYFLVELLTGAAFLGAWLMVYQQFVSGREPAIETAFTAAMVTLALVTLLAGLIASTFIDIEHFIIPDEITKGGMATGVVFSLAAPQLHGAYLGQDIGHFHALWLSLLGMACGGGIIYAIAWLGKLMFGKETFSSDEPCRVTFATHALHVETEDDGPEIVRLYEDIFFRNSDTITLHGLRVEMIDRCFWDRPITITDQIVTIGPDQFPIEEVTHLEATTLEIVVPREAMGFGDVKFMAAIGAFLGWQATLFTLMASAMVGAAVGLTLKATRKDTGIIPYGPYLAMAAAGWVFGGYRLWDTWWRLTQ
jgi:leader peptidase (prepilin peptidase)/N-methyltransferase